MRLLLAFLAIVFIADSSHGRAEGVPPLINYQGRLTDQAATPLAAGNYGIQFRLWDSPTATNSTDLIWGQQQNVIVFTNGVFNIILGGTGTTLGGSANDLTSSFGSNNRYLGITIVSSNDVTISSASEILPRQQLLSVPFAVQAQQAQRATTADVAQTVAQPTAAMLAPPGAIVAFGGVSIPNGWLLCDGSLVGRTQYPDLWNAIGTTWGLGDGSITFNLPDLRGYFLRGVDGSAGRDPDKNSRTPKGGRLPSEVGSTQADEFKLHNHDNGINNKLVRNDGNSTTIQTDFTPGEVDSHNAAPIQPAGGNETRPKNVYVHYIIKY